MPDQVKYFGRHSNPRSDLRIALICRWMRNEPRGVGVDGLPDEMSNTQLVTPESDTMRTWRRRSISMALRSERRNFGYRMALSITALAMASRSTSTSSPRTR